MNKKQKKRKLEQRKYNQRSLKKQFPSAKIIKNWKELASILQESETHILRIDLRMHYGFIERKIKNNNWKDEIYLSTHTFYEENYKYSTRLLQEAGFNVILKNWDE